MEPQVIKMIPWHGGECPVPEGTSGLVKICDGSVFFSYDLSAPSWKLGWVHDADSPLNHIVKYAVVNLETAKPALRDLRGWVIEGNGVPWWASKEGLCRSPLDAPYYPWHVVEDFIAHDDGRTLEKLRPMTPADLGVKG